jgi:hypothetical protein
MIFDQQPRKQDKIIFKRPMSLGLYFFFSLFSTLIIFMGESFSDWQIHLDKPVTKALGVLLVGNWWGYQRFNTYFGISRGLFLPIYFLFQIVVWFAVSALSGRVDGLYFSCIPLLGALTFIQSQFNTEVKTEDKLTRSLALLSLVVIGHFIVYKNFLKGRIEVVDMSYVFGFFICEVGIVFLAQSNWQKEVKNLFSQLAKKKKSEVSKNSLGIDLNNGINTQQREKYFYHDLINFTHGITLFLNNKVISKRSLTFEEVLSLLNEIKTMQSVVKDYFGHEHKNLTMSYDWVSFDFAKNGILNLVTHYLPEHQVDVSFIFKGQVSEDRSVKERDQALVHYPTLYRVLNNIIKNMSEAKTDRVEVIFDYQEDGLFIETKNRLLSLNDRPGLLAENLSQIILDESLLTDTQGVGLDSVASLCQERGGKYSFEVVDGHWVNRIFLPAYPHKEDSKVA